MHTSRHSLFEALTWPHLDRLLAAAQRLVSAADLAEDLVQDTYIKAWQNFGTLKDVDKVYGWLYRIMRREVADHYRQHDRRQALLPIVNLDADYESVLGNSRDEPFEQLSRQLAQQRLTEMLQRLPDEFAEALILHDMEGFKYREIAEITDTPLGTVMSRIHRARAMLVALAGRGAENRTGTRSIQESSES